MRFRNSLTLVAKVAIYPPLFARLRVDKFSFVECDTIDISKNEIGDDIPHIVTDRTVEGEFCVNDFC